MSVFYALLSTLNINNLCHKIYQKPPKYINDSASHLLLAATIKCRHDTGTHSHTYIKQSFKHINMQGVHAPASDWKPYKRGRQVH